MHPGGLVNERKYTAMVLRLVTGRWSMSKLNIKLEENEKANMTPMIDVVFLLIIFFMLVSQFSNQVLTAGILLPEADQSVPDEQDRRMVVNVDRGGKFTLNGVTYPPEALSGRIEAYGQLRMTTLENGENISDMKVMIRGDKSTKYQYIQKVYGMLQNSRIWQVSFATHKE